MPTTVNIPPQVKKDIKHLKRKYKAIIKEIRELVKQLENDERPGDEIPNIGYDVYKVRLANPSANRGKSGGFRVIYYVQMQDVVFLVRVYSKTEESNVSSERIRQILDDILSTNDDSEDG